MTSNYKYYDAELDDYLDLDDKFITDAELIDRFVNNQLWAWGENDKGRLGDGTTVDKSTPIRIGFLADWKQVSAGSDYTMAIKNDGTLWGWGNNGGNLGTNNTTNYSSPVQVGLLTNWKQVSAGLDHSLAVKKDGTLWAWGNNGSGRLGDGTTLNKSSPVQIGLLTDWKQVAAGDNWSLAIKNDYTLWAWGSNDDGQLGDGTRTAQSSPIQIGILTNWKQVAAGKGNGGRRFSAAVKTDGTLWVWGSNANGQFGDGTIVDKSSPIQVGTLTNWKQVALSWGSTLAVKTDGTLWAWGNNDKGELGDGTKVDKSSPIQVGLLTNWKQVDAGGDDITRQTSVAVKTDGTLWGWGDSQIGVTGLGDTVDRSSPTQVSGSSYWKQVSIAYLHCGAIAEN